MGMTVDEFVNNIFDDKSGYIVLFDVENNNILYKDTADNIPQCLLERYFDQIEYTKNSTILRLC